MMLLIDMSEVLTPLEVQWLRPIIEKYVHSLSKCMSELLSDAVWETVANLYSMLPIERICLYTLLLIDGTNFLQLIYNAIQVLPTTQCIVLLPEA